MAKKLNLVDMYGIGVMLEYLVAEDNLTCEERDRVILRIARENAGWDAEIVDKWVDYSMIQEEGYRARAVVEALREIAVRPSEGNQQ